MNAGQTDKCMGGWMAGTSNACIDHLVIKQMNSRMDRCAAG